MRRITVFRLKSAALFAVLFAATSWLAMSSLGLPLTACNRMAILVGMAAAIRGWLE